MSAATASTLQLRDIHLPGPAPFWPPAPGWWVVAALVVLLVGWLSIAAWRRRDRARARRRLLAALAALQADFARDRSSEHLARVARLMRRIALSRFPRERVAALSGAAWLRFLDESGGAGQFSNGPGRVLASAPYQRSVPPDLDIDAFAETVRAWVDINTRNPA